MKKKLITMLLATLMMLGLAPGIVHADPLPPTQGDLVIHKYLMDDLSGAGAPGNGTPLASGALPAGATPLDNITFKIYQVTIPSSGIYPAPGAYTLDNYTSPTQVTDANSDVFTVTAASVSSVTTDSTGEATAAGLPQGVYLVVEQANAQVASPAAPFVVAVPMTDAAGTGWLDVVHVYPKNENLTVEKVASVPSVKIGDVVDFSIIPSVPAELSKAKKYDIIDVMDEALDYVTGSVSVVGAATKAGLASGTALIDPTDYTVDYDAPTRTLTISLTAAGRAEVEAQGYKFLQIDFKAATNAKILNKVTHTVDNQATLDFVNQFDEQKTPGSNTTGTHTGRIEILKVDAQSTTALPGAEFKIASSLANAQADIFLHKDAAGAVLGSGDTGYASASDWVVTTDASGKASFDGLLDYIDNTATGGSIDYQSYWLVETKAPNGGYNLLTTPEQVTFDSSAVSSNAYTKGVTIKNTKGFTLPQTGGAGTLVFTVLGVALIGSALILLLMRRKNKARQDSE